MLLCFVCQCHDAVVKFFLQISQLRRSFILHTTTCSNHRAETEANKKTAENCRIVLKTIQPCHSYHSCLLLDFPFIWMLIKGNNAKICLFFASYSMSDTFLKSSTLGRGFKGQIQHRKGLNLVTTPSSQEDCSWQDYFAFDGLILSYQ